MRKLLAGLLSLLLLTVDSSIQTSIAFDRSLAWWTPWLYKIGAMSLADGIIIAVTAYTLAYISCKGRLVVSPYLALCGWAGVYLGIGLIYNLFVYTFWKTFLYDVKTVLYLTVPYLFFRYCATEKVQALFTPPRIFLLLALGNLVDFMIVTLWGQAEYPRYLGLPSVPQLLPLPVGLIALAYARRGSYRLGFLLLVAVELLLVVNRLALSSLYNLMVSLGLALALHLRLRLGGKFQLVLLWVVVTNLISIFLLSNPFDWELLSAKSGGAITRQAQMDNVLLNAQRDIPGIVGKGLGSTWFEYVPIPDYDIYSVGTSVGATAQESLYQPVKFVFNFGAASLLHKWGVLGSLVLVFLVVRYYEVAARRINDLARLRRSDPRARYLIACLLVSVIFVFENFTYIGNLRNSLVTSLLAFSVDHALRIERAARGTLRERVASTAAPLSSCRVA